MALSDDQVSFDPDFSGPADWAEMYRRRGLQVVPAHFPDARNPAFQWKRPKLPDWKQLQEELVPDLTFQRWYGRDGEHASREQMGFLTGHCSGNVGVIDLDTHTKPAALHWWRGLLELHNNGIEPETWEQVTGGGGRQILLQFPPDMIIPTIKTAIGVDIRGQGGFAMLPPSRHESQRTYAWLEGRAPYEIEIDAAPKWLCQAIMDLWDEHGGGHHLAPVERAPSSGADLDAFGNRVDGREDYMTRLVWGAVLDMHRECPLRPSEAESSAAMRRAYQVYERAVKSRLSGAEPKAQLLEREGRGATLFADKWRRAVSKWDGDVAQGAALPKLVPDDWERALEAPPDSVEEAKPANLTLQPAFPITAGDIPPRDWVVPGLLLHRHLSVLVAPPGSGKSLLTLQIAMSVSTGAAWGGWTVRKPAKTLVINSEDDIDEMRRRLLAASRSMAIPQDSISGRLLLADAPESIVIARTEAKTKTVARTPLLEQLIETIKSHAVECVVVDPFAETFEGDENANSEVKWAAVLWREVARRTGASVFLVHHTRKYASGMAGDADASRGGGSLVGVARIVSTLFNMTEEEATTLGVMPEDRTKYVRFDDAKANLSLVTGQAKWFEKVTVPLGNARDLMPEDEVGVLVPWSPPGAFDGVSVATIHLVLSTIDRGCLDGDGQPTGHFYTRAATSTDKSRWVGTPIMQMLGCDEAKAKKIIKEWAGSGLLVDFEYDDPRGRQTRKGTRTDAAKWPGAAT